MKLERFKKVMLSFAAAALVFVYSATEAHAGWGSFGGGSHGSWGGSLGQGSSGGSWGGSRGHFHRGSHGGPIRNLVSRIRSRHSHGGSWGGSRGFASRGYASRGYSSRGYSSFGSQGGSRGYSYYSSSRGGSTGWGSTGHTSVGYGNSTGYSRPYYDTTTPYSPAVEYGNGFVNPPEGGGEPTEAAPIENGSTPPPGPEGTNTGDSSDNNTALLNLRVPAETVVYVNGRRTSTPGNFRSYVSRNLVPGQNYSYEVRAELNQNGKTLARTKVVQLTAGTNKTVDIDFHEQAETITSVTLFVPEDATVKLGGVETDLTGAVRYFSTTSLKEGDQWNSYHVSVTVDRDGKPVTRERVIDVNAGDSAKLRFDFDTDEQIATR